MSRICEINNKATTFGNRFSRSNQGISPKKKRCFYPNLQKKRIYAPELGCWITIKVSTSAMRTIAKKGFFPVIRKAHKKGELSGRLSKLITLYHRLNPLSHGEKRQ